MRISIIVLLSTIKATKGWEIPHYQRTFVKIFVYNLRVNANQCFQLWQSTAILVVRTYSQR